MLIYYIIYYYVMLYYIILYYDMFTNLAFPNCGTTSTAPGVGTIEVLLCDETLLGALREGISALGEFVGIDGTDDQWLMCLEHGDL